MEDLNTETLKQMLLPETATTQDSAAKEKEPTAQELLDKALELRMSGPTSAKNERQIQKLQKQLKMQARQARSQKRMFEQYFSIPQKKRNKKIQKLVQVAKSQLSKDDFRMLKDIFTVKTPEQKDDAGNVIKKVQSQVQYETMLKEVPNAIALNRDSNIQSGNRKKTTGSSSNRKAHRSTMNFIHGRNIAEQTK